MAGQSSSDPQHDSINDPLFNSKKTNYQDMSVAYMLPYSLNQVNHLFTEPSQQETNKSTPTKSLPALRLSQAMRI